MAPAFQFLASRRDLRNPVFWRDVVSELLVVTILMTTITLALVSNDPKLYPVTTTHIGLFAGCLVYLLIEGYGPISGAHLNPVASLAFWMAGHISFARAIFYMIVQTIGAAAGSGIGYVLTPWKRLDEVPGPFAAFNPAAHGLTNGQGVAIEAFFTFNLIFVALSCLDTKNRPSPALMPGLAIAFCIAIGIMAAGTHTGGLMNPAVAFGPALLARDFTNHWIYWVGPFIGGPLAVAVYKLFVLIKNKWQPKPANEANELKPTGADTSKDIYRLLDELQAKIKAIDAAAAV